MVHMIMSQQFENLYIITQILLQGNQAEQAISPYKPYFGLKQWTEMETDVHVWKNRDCEKISLCSIGLTQKRDACCLFLMQVTKALVSVY